MANGHGGYRKPEHPAAASGPGRLSKRTDGRQPTRPLPNAKYGEGQAFEQAQSAAPMSGDIGALPTPSPSGGPAPAGPDLSGLIPLDAPSQRPDEPLTAGMSGGMGAGPSVHPAGPRVEMTDEHKGRLRSYLPALILMASRDDVDPSTKQLIRQMRADLG